MSESARGCKRESLYVCVGGRGCKRVEASQELVRVCERESEGVCEGVREGANERESVCETERGCEREGESEKERERVRKRESVYVCIRDGERKRVCEKALSGSKLIKKSERGG